MKILPLHRQIRPLLLAALALLPCHPQPALANPGNANCPIMTADEADPDTTVSYQGIEIAFCCGPCVKQFKKEPDYYAKLFQEMGSVPQLQGVKVPDGVTLLPQRFCPFSTDRLVGPSSPSVEYRGVKIYLSKPGHVATWQAEPDKHARHAFEKGLLPQLKGKL